MIFRIFTEMLSSDTILATIESMEKKHGRRGYEEMANSGFDRPFSKYHREFMKLYLKNKRKK